MNTQDFIVSEKARLQSLFGQFNEGGAWMVMQDRHYAPLRFGLIDSYTVTRIAPHFDAEGDVTKTDFWLFFKEIGYEKEWHYSHTFKVVDWNQEDTYEIDLTDDRGRRYHIELIMEVSEYDMTLDWKKWRRYKAENKDLFGRVDAHMLEEHIAIAEEWPQ